MVQLAKPACDGKPGITIREACYAYRCRNPAAPHGLCCFHFDVLTSRQQFWFSLARRCPLSSIQWLAMNRAIRVIFRKSQMRGRN